MSWWYAEKQALERLHRFGLASYSLLLSVDKIFAVCSFITEFIVQLIALSYFNSATLFQVPQFILDDMIDSGHGGYCNIICTQPRRIAVSISLLRCDTVIYWMI